MTVNIITTPTRPGRAENVTLQFSGKNNFQLIVLGSRISASPIIDLLKKQKEAVQKSRLDDHVLIVEDDHVFSDTYTSAKLVSAIREASENNFDVLLGGVDKYGGLYAIPGAKDVVGIKHFGGVQFLIVFHKFYDELLSIKEGGIHLEDYLSTRGHIKKGVIVPFVSYQMDSTSHFGRSYFRKDEFKRVEDELVLWAEANKISKQQK